MAKLKTVQDQMGNEVHVPYSPTGIVSLVPSQTELLFYFGLDDIVKGVTKFCIHPAHARSKTIIGGTKKFHFDKIDALSPDLILGNKEENYQEGILKLRQNYPVWVSDIFVLQDAMDMIIQLGELTDKTNMALDLAAKIEHKFTTLRNHIRNRGTALYLIWQQPFMAAGGNTFINTMLDYAGFENAIAHLDRYPELTLDDIKTLAPDYLLLSSEPFPFKPKHASELQAQFPSVKVEIVDGEYFSWYGSRLLEAADYLQTLAI